MTLKLSPTSKLSEALALGSGVLEYVIALNPHDFSRLRKPLMRRLMPPRITLRRLAQMIKKPLLSLLLELHEAAGEALSDKESQEIEELCGESAEILPQSPGQRPAWTFCELQRTVDLLESDDRLDGDPLRPIGRAMRELGSAGPVLIKHRWEPQPLYDVWSRGGFEFFAENKTEDEWWIYLRRAAR